MVNNYYITRFTGITKLINIKPITFKNHTQRAMLNASQIIRYFL